ncbi:Gamma-Crystallin D [Manis pentadactyla]|nr:Gamma-Crystallin D [Manis pentadactyla]
MARLSFRFTLLTDVAADGVSSGYFLRYGDYAIQIQGYSAARVKSMVMVEFPGHRVRIFDTDVRAMAILSFRFTLCMADVEADVVCSGDINADVKCSG